MERMEKRPNGSRWLRVLEFDQRTALTKSFLQEIGLSASFGQAHGPQQAHTRLSDIQILWKSDVEILRASSSRSQPPKHVAIHFVNRAWLPPY